MSYKTKVSLIGMGMAVFVFVGWAAAAGDVVYVSSFDNDTVVKFDAETGRHSAFSFQLEAAD